MFGEKVKSLFCKYANTPFFIVYMFFDDNKICIIAFDDLYLYICQGKVSIKTVNCVKLTKEKNFKKSVDKWHYLWYHIIRVENVCVISSVGRAPDS